MWQRFTERARRIVFYAQEEAGRSGENYVSTEHLLLGLTRENDSVAACILDRLDIGLGRIRTEIERQTAQGTPRLGQDMQLTPRAKRVIDLAYDEARFLNNNYIGTEHILLGLIREGEGIAGRVLDRLGIGLERTREAVISIQDKAPQAETKTSADQDRRDANRSFAIGNLGHLVSPEGRAGVEVVVDPAAFAELADVFSARDGYGYQELIDLGKVFVAVAGERVKRVVPTQEITANASPPAGVFVRILEGVHEGRKGWISLTAFEHIGPDETPFPPEVSVLPLDFDEGVF